MHMRKVEENGQEGNHSPAISGTRGYFLGQYDVALIARISS